jgi:hypothetical protein
MKQKTITRIARIHADRSALSHVIAFPRIVDPELPAL